MLEIREQEDYLEFSGYVNAVERESKVLADENGRFIEIMKAGVFKRALEKGNQVKLLLNHDFKQDLGNDFSLQEDAIGLKIEGRIRNRELIQDFKNGLVNGFSFGFNYINKVSDFVNGIEKRLVSDINLYEVSILSGKIPAYTGTVIETRSEDNGLTALIMGEKETKYEVRESNLSYETKEEIIEDVKSDEEDKEKEILIEETLNDNKASEEDVQEASKDKAENQLEMIDDLKKFILTEKIKSEIKGLRN